VDSLLAKLQYRSGSITVVGAPPELASTLEDWSADGPVSTRLAKGATFVVAFVRSAAELHRSIGRVVPKLADSAVLWFAYPKKSSTRYPSSDLGRDDSWQELGDCGFEAVRQVAVDADWSALRFRRAGEIPTMVRDPNRAMSRSGRARTTRRPAAVVEFLGRAREGRAPLIEAVDATVRRAAPELKVELDGKFLGYGPFHYRYATGHEGDTFVVAMMDGAQALSVYVMGGDGGQWLVEGNAERLGKVSVGKSCIRIKRLDQINLDVLGEIVRTAADQHADVLRTGVSEGGSGRR
jgi:hypothetical protein